jgi:hypothetical protein
MRRVISAGWGDTDTRCLAHWINMNAHNADAFFEGDKAVCGLMEEVEAIHIQPSKSLTASNVRRDSVAQLAQEALSAKGVHSQR